MLFDKFRYLIEGKFLIKNPLGMHKHYRTHRAKSIASCFNDLDFLVKAALFQFIVNGILDGKASR
jgi:hypothetical protein